MDKYDFLNLVVRKVEEAFPDVICFATFDSEIKVWEININDFEIYMRDEKFKKFTKPYYKMAQKFKIKIVFCYRLADERLLTELLQQENLIMNI